MNDKLKTALHRDLGTAVPVFTMDLVPVSLCSPEARKAYDAWQRINGKGDALLKEHRAASAAWIKEHPQRDYSSREQWLHARDKHLRPQSEALAANARKAMTALLEFDRISRGPGGMVPAEEAARHHDAEARRLWAELMATMAAREEASRYAGSRFSNTATIEARGVTNVSTVVRDLGAMVRGFAEVAPPAALTKEQREHVDASPVIIAHGMGQSFEPHYAAEAAKMGAHR